MRWVTEYIQEDNNFLEEEITWGKETASTLVFLMSLLER